MDYNLEALSWRQFEQMTQALCLKNVGPGVSVFGDGPDGGREATWQGDYPSLGVLDRWNGYAVLQAKMHLHPEDPRRNLSWLTTQIKSELDDWAAPTTKRSPQPDFILFATNVRLSPSGKDAIKKTIKDHVEKLQLPLRDYRVWDNDDLRGLLDDAPGIRSKYSALITPGDLISQLIDRQDADQRNFAEALTVHAASQFIDDFHLKLSQAGTYGDNRIAVADVFVDLPLEDPIQVGGRRHDEEDERVEPNIVAGLIQRFDYLTTAADSDLAIQKKCVLIGGPGQGKSTVTQFLAQIYRASFLTTSALSRDQDLMPDIERVLARAKAIGIPLPKARRWPFRIDLTHLADSLACDETGGILEYIASSIGKSSERTVNVDQLHEWLANFPWLLIFDGLDEVPNSSNREQVIRAIRDFSLKATSVGADLTILATTRPQGYSEEFDPDAYTHIELASLPISVALDYAKAFISVRMEAGSTRAETIYKGLLRASADESTTKLFSSPLQVTILTVLIETSGQVPKDRWKLFLRYYDVINQRELEKGGELSELLQDYETDVLWLHRHIGNLLQHRSSGVGDTSATISRDEFLEIIRDRLIDMGHEPSKVAFLTEEFLRLVTDRLVFLAVVSSGRIGFEIRSLQEFMAGAYISELPDAEIIPTIRRLSKIPYWRNVVLFAIGYIFTSKGHLKADIPLLCDELDDDEVDGDVVRSGGLLALDILLDGAAQSQPRFARPLARRAALLLQGPIQPRVVDFASFSDDVVGPILRSSTLSLDDTTPSGWINRVLASCEMLSDTELRREHIRSIFELAGEVSRAGILKVASDRENFAIIEALEEHVGTYSPSTVLSSMTSIFLRSHKHEEQSPQWLTMARRASARAGGRNVLRFGGSPRNAFQFSLIPLSANAEEWKTVSELEFTHPGWQFLIAIGKFVQDPSKAGLADLIRSMKTLDPADRVFADSGPWVLAACYGAAVRYWRVSDSPSIEESLESLALRCLAGELGSPEDWRAIENRFELTRFDVDQQFVGPRIDQGSDTSLPIWPGLSREGISLFGAALSYRIPMPEDEEQFKHVAADLQALVNFAKTAIGNLHEAAVLNFVSFVASLAVEYLNPFGESRIIESDSWETLQSFLEGACIGLRDGSPLSARWALTNPEKNMQRQDYPRILEKLGGMTLENRIRPVPVEQARWVKSGATFSVEGWKRYRLAFAYAPELVYDLEEYERIYILSKEQEDPTAASLAMLVSLTHAQKADLEAGRYDEGIRCLFSDYIRGDRYNLDQLWRIAVSNRSKSLDVLRRIVKVSSREFPFEAIRYVDMLGMPLDESGESL